MSQLQSGPWSTRTFARPDAPAEDSLISRPQMSLIHDSKRSLPQESGRGIDNNAGSLVFPPPASSSANPLAQTVSLAALSENFFASSLVNLHGPAVDGAPSEPVDGVGGVYRGGGFDHVAAGVGGSAAAVGIPTSGANDKEYKMKREKNNEAVRKSRQKTKNRTQETARRVELLHRENDELEQRAKSLTNELSLLKEIFVRQMRSGQEEGEEEDN